MNVRCFHCGKVVSTEVPSDFVMRAVATCPECIKEEGMSLELIIKNMRIKAEACGELDRAAGLNEAADILEEGVEQ